MYEQEVEMRLENRYKTPLVDKKEEDRKNPETNIHNYNNQELEELNSY